MKRQKRGKKWPGATKAPLPKSAVTLVAWDLGAMGPANRQGLEIEEAVDATPEGKAENPNGIIRARRIGKLEQWHRNYLSQAMRNGKPQPYITTRQFNAAESYLDALEATMRATGWPDNDRVQSSPKPDHAITIQIDRISRFHEKAKHLTAEEKGVIETAIFGAENMGKGQAYYVRFERLRAVLDKLADHLDGTPKTWDKR